MMQMPASFPSASFIRDARSMPLLMLLFVKNISKMGTVGVTPDVVSHDVSRPTVNSVLCDNDRIRESYVPYPGAVPPLDPHGVHLDPVIALRVQRENRLVSGAQR